MLTRFHIFALSLLVVAPGAASVHAGPRPFWVVVRDASGAITSRTFNAPDDTATTAGGWAITPVYPTTMPGEAAQPAATWRLSAGTAFSAVWTFDGSTGPL